MNLIVKLLSQRKLVLTLTSLLSLLGLFFWANMARQEDPRLPDLWGQVITAFPGADAETVERLVLEPLEERLAAVDQIKELASTAYAGLAVIKIDLLDNVKEPDAAWDDVEDALAKARRDFPQGVTEPQLNDQLQDNESIVYALTGHPDPLELARRAEDLKDLLLALPEVSEVKIIADPEEQVTLELDDAEARRLGLRPHVLAAQLRARNQILPGGSIELGGRTVTLRPVSELESLADIRGTAITVADGSTVPLGAIANVRQGPAEPATSYMRLDGQPGVGIGIIPKAGGNILLFGEAVRELMSTQAESLAPIELDEVIFQPARVQERLQGLSRSLLLGVMIVAGVLMLAMGLRMGLIVASVVPLVVLSSLAIYAIGGGILHQMSIAALVIALGMLVDNAIVVAEGIQWRLDRGEPRRQAAIASVRELAIPLAAATATTLAAFIPMLLAEGATGEFTRAIPIVIMLTLTISYLFAVFVTPTLSEMFLRRQPRDPADIGRSRARRMARFSLRRPGLVLVLAGAAVALSLLSFGGVQQEFFPSSDRNQLVVDLRLPEGSHLDATDRRARELERALLEHPQVVSVASFVGRSTPKFYYNLNFIPFSPHLAQMIVVTTSTDTLDSVMTWLRNHSQQEMPGVEMVVRKLEQGPSIEAPVEIRIYGSEMEALHSAAEVVLSELRRIPGTEDVRQTLGSGAPMMRFRIDDAAAARRNLQRADVAQALFGRTRGLPVGEFRAGDDPIPIVLRSSAGENYPVSELDQIDVSGAGGDPVPLSQVARVDLEWRPAAIHHFNGRRVVRVLSELGGETGYVEVLKQLLPRLEKASFPEAVVWEVGGAEEGSGEANVAMMRVLPVGVLLLLGILMAEFRSFRRVGIVLVTVPLAAAGIVPGLLVAGQPFGFMSLLGVFALIGVVVNNAIVLLEVVEARRAEGATVAEALEDAVERRMRPILLTSATTVAGLLPLALSPSTLWPPMAWAMISGLLASTLLTLVVVPALYSLLFRPWGPRRREVSKPLVAGMLALMLLGAGAAAAQEPVGKADRMTLSQALEAATRRPSSQAAGLRADAADRAAVARRRSALWPTLAAEVSVNDRTENFDLRTPVGDVRFGSSRSEDVAVAVVQPLLDPSRWFYASPSARADAEAAAHGARRVKEHAAAQAAEAFLDVLSIDARRDVTKSFIASLEGRLEEGEAKVLAGRALVADTLKLRLALDSARQDLLALDQARDVALFALGRATGNTGPVEPVRIGEVSVPSSPELSVAVASARARRPDLEALRQELRSTGLKRSGVKAERLPRLEASARWIHTTGSPYRQNSWVEGGLALKWNPFAAGTRAPRIEALSREIEAREAELTEARRSVELEIRAALAGLETARGALKVGETGVEQASETRRVENERYLAGRATTNDLLDSESALRDQSTRRDLARLDLLRAWIHLQLALGTPAGPGMLPPAG